jgi:hypothetical protein
MTELSQVNINEINRGPAKLSLANTQLSPTNSDIARPLVLTLKPEALSESALSKNPSQLRGSNFVDSVNEIYFTRLSGSDPPTSPPFSLDSDH